MMKAVLFAVLVAGLTSSAYFVAAHAASPSIYNLGIDTATYERLAMRLVDARDVRVLPPTQPPGFLAFLALLFATFGHSYLAVKLTFSVLLAATAALAAVTLWTRAGPLAAVLAAALTIFSPLLTVYAATLQYEIVAAFLTTLILALIVWRPRAAGTLRHISWAVAFGVACAVSALTREVLAVLLPLGMAAAVATTPSGQWRRTTVVLVMAIGFAAPVAAWSWVQHRNSGRWVFLSDKSDAVFRIGHNPTANGAYTSQLQPVTEPSGWTFIREHPRQEVALSLRKAALFWGLARDPWSVPQPTAAIASRAMLHGVPYEWVVNATRGGVIALLFIVGLPMVVRRPGLWPLSAIVLLITGAHVFYYGSQRFSAPVFAQICSVAALPLAAVVRGIWRSPRSVRAAVVLVGVWIVIAQTIRSPGRYRLEAEDLEGISATNVADPTASNGSARFARAGKASRPIAFLSGEVIPRGVFGLRVHARTSTCSEPDRPALSIALRDDKDLAPAKQAFTVGDLCRGPGYAVLPAAGILRRDTVAFVSVESLDSVDVWVDRVDVLFGYRELRQVRSVVE